MTARGTRLRYLPPVLLFLAVGALYAATAAPATLFGDPSEYQFIPAVLGIAHPPGYAFYTLLARLWQILVPVGTIAYRTNLLSAAIGAWVVTAVYLAARELAQVMGGSGGADTDRGDRPGVLALGQATAVVAPLAAALALAAAPDVWQHSIHANAHIVSAGLATTHLWLLMRWWRTGRDRWLAALALTVGLAASHHPITLMGLPAYVVFILMARPRILRQWRTLGLVFGFGLLGLTPLLYYPLRSPTAPFGPTDMRTWQGFWRHFTAQGLRGNLFHFGLADQPHRALVLWSLLRLQFLLPVLLLIPLGLLYLVRRVPRAALLFSLFLLVHLGFTLNSVQDVMAYLLLPLAALALVAGAGAQALLTLLVRSAPLPRSAPPPGVRSRVSPAAAIWCVAVLTLVLSWPFLQAALNLRRGISLRHFVAAEEYVAAVQDKFSGAGSGTVLLSDWEHLTPLWVHTYTQGLDLAEDNLKLVYVSTSNPWVQSVWAHIEDVSIYLPDYRPSVRDEGFRLVPEGSFYRVVAPPVVDAVPSFPLDVLVDGRIRILGYDLATTKVSAGGWLVLTLYQTASEPVEGIWMPYAQLGPVEARWTTDSRVLTTQWLPGEVVVERFEIPVPFSLPPGQYPLRLGYADLSNARSELPLSTGGTTLELATITVSFDPGVPARHVPETAIANLDNQVALMASHTGAVWQVRSGIWQEPLTVRGGEAIHLALTWRALAPPRESLTVFIHLLDSDGRYAAGYDYTPLGGACPTYLWFPKWLPGQTLIDPYRFALPAHLPPGTYWLEVGMYGMTSLRRLPVVDSTGSLAGDRVVLGPVRVE